MLSIRFAINLRAILEEVLKLQITFYHSVKPN